MTCGDTSLTSPCSLANRARSTARLSSMADYDHKSIEPRWQERWAKAGIAEVDLKATARPFFMLMMYPYPSGDRLHVGHGRNYILGDALFRYRRMQGVVTREPEQRDIEALLADSGLRMVNRNRGAGTRVLIDRLLDGRRPEGYGYEPRSHYAVAAAVAQGRADWGVTIETVAVQAGLRFRPLQDEHYDFVVAEGRDEVPAVEALERLLAPESPVRKRLTALGFRKP